jgi:hypothetical protein
MVGTSGKKINLNRKLIERVLRTFSRSLASTALVIQT